LSGSQSGRVSIGGVVQLNSDSRAWLAALSVVVGAAAARADISRTFTIDTARSTVNLTYSINGFQGFDTSVISGTVTATWPTSGSGPASIGGLMLNVADWSMTTSRPPGAQLYTHSVGAGVRGASQATTACARNPDGTVVWTPFTHLTAGTGILTFTTNPSGCLSQSLAGLACEGTMQLDTSQTASVSVDSIKITSLAGGGDEIEVKAGYAVPVRLGTQIVGTCLFSTIFRGVATGPTCRVDFDNSGTATVDDIFIFINAWFAADPRTDFDNNGTRGIDDIFIYLAAWFGGC
jgi:hypothetical protein